MPERLTAMEILLARLDLGKPTFQRIAEGKEHLAPRSAEKHLNTYRNLVDGLIPFIQDQEPIPEKNSFHFSEASNVLSVRYNIQGKHLNITQQINQEILNELNSLNSTTVENHDFTENLNALRYQAHIFTGRPQGDFNRLDRETIIEIITSHIREN